jgi:hypothetical protein
LECDVFISATVLYFPGSDILPLGDISFSETLVIFCKENFLIQQQLIPYTQTATSHLCTWKAFRLLVLKTKLRGLSPQANYTDQATAEAESFFTCS